MLGRASRRNPLQPTVVGIAYPSATETGYGDRYAAVNEMRRRSRWLYVGAAAAWVGALIVPLTVIVGVTVQVVIVVEMFLLSVAITASVLGFIAKALPPVAAAWFLGYRDGVEAERERAQHLRVVR